MNKVKVNEIYETTDYDLFKFHETNRDVRYRKDLYEEAEKGFIAPIVVDKDMTVIDGQNRLYHAKMAGVSIKYFVDPTVTVRDIVRMNTTAISWSLTDYIKSFSKEGNEDYKKLLELISLKYAGQSVTVTVACNEFQSSGGITNKIKNGSFYFENYESTVRFLKFYRRLASDAKFPKFIKLGLALFQISKVKKFDEERFIYKFKNSTKRDEIVSGSNKNKYLEILLDIYNAKAKENSDFLIDYYFSRSGELIINEEMED